jgi:hypothetical protein
MTADQVIEMYIDDTVRLLPRRQRDDVAAELRALLAEGLRDRAREAGRPPDKALALALVRDYGRPNEVAARYQPGWTILDPTDTRSFMRAAIIGTGVLLLLSVLRNRPFPVQRGRQLLPMPGTADDVIVFGILAWLGALLVTFRVKSWIHRTWPATALWKPRDRDQVNRIGTAILVPIASLIVILYAAPAWVFDRIFGGGLDTSWAAYTAEFQRLRLPWFIASLVGLLALVSFVAIQGRWSRLTRRINIGLNMALAGLVLSFAVTGHIFQSSALDQLAQSVLALVAVIYVPCIGVQIYSELGRINRAATTKGA